MIHGYITHAVKQRSTRITGAYRSSPTPSMNDDTIHGHDDYSSAKRLVEVMQRTASKHMSCTHILCSDKNSLLHMHNIIYRAFMTPSTMTSLLLLMWGCFRLHLRQSQGLHYLDTCVCSYNLPLYQYSPFPNHQWLHH
jgi:ribosomal protein S17E